MFKCKFCQFEKLTSHSVNAHQARCSHNPDKKISSGNTGKTAWNKGKTKTTNSVMLQISKKLSGKPGRIISDEERERISVGMKKAHQEHRAWNIGMNRWKKQPSYAEKFFKDCIDNDFNDKLVKQEVYFKGFVIDFLWEHKNAVIEIDGKQHDHPTQKDRDARKDALLREHGYRILRIRWRDMQANPKHWIKVAIAHVGK